jgi:hypothetical protein
MRHAMLSAATLAALVLLPACAGPRAGEGTSPAPVTDRRVVRYPELQEAIAQNMGTVLQFVRSRRSEWLSSPLAGVRGQVQVWMDEQRLGGPETLRTIPLSAVTELRYLTPSEAQARFGLNNLGGVILVSTR